ncbi:hypothetical protein [Paludisphaera soli]|uniref:hypothetical protein n=1 Tax=Paludisphaera soli TaxID=2712865 RepID=UPI0013ED9743|nr:hypothetical protein [Paludisphaera soli]
MIVPAMLIGLAVGWLAPAAPESGDGSLGAQVEAILAELERADASWPDDVVAAVRSALAGGQARAIHKALADRVFLDVTINPEGRVKVARGPAAATLRQGRTTRVLVKVENLSGGRQRLQPQGAYAGGGENPFTLDFPSHDGLTPELVGLEVEYRLLAVTASRPGRHELTVSMEAGQGTQDLGFRAQAPVLFMVEAEAGK